MTGIQGLRAHWGFTRTPFTKDLAPSMLHRHPGHAEAVARIAWCVEEAAIRVITGEVGAGKTVAARAALGELDASRHTVIYLGNPAVGARGIYMAIVTRLGHVPRFHKASLSTGRPATPSPPKPPSEAGASCSPSTKRTYWPPTNSRSCGC
jgi:type II secretory pathway predicted ATPase ExeA